MKRISILGATGSIGQNTIDLVRRDPAGFEVVALTGGQNVTQLAQDAIALDAEIAVTADETRLDDLRAALKGESVIIRARLDRLGRTLAAMRAEALAVNASGEERLIATGSVTKAITTVR